MTETVTTAAESLRPLHVIADEIFADWKTMREKGEMHPAYPYADSMRSLDSIEDRYVLDSGEGIVRYFLANAGGWRGDVARRVKAELKSMVDVK